MPTRSYKLTANGKDVAAAAVVPAPPLGSAQYINGETGIESSACVMWRNTANCDPHGPRLPSNIALDQPCTGVNSTLKAQGDSGYCECKAGNIYGVGCGAPTGFAGKTCADVCAAGTAHAGYGKTLPYEIQFVADLPALSLTTFSAQASSEAISEDEYASVDVASASPHAPVVIENDLYSLTFGGNGTLDAVTNKQTKVTLPVNQDFFYYEACSIQGQGAGPYMFRPDATKTDKDGQNIPRVRGDSPAKLTVSHTAVGSEIRQVFSDWVTQVIRLPVGSAHPEFEMSIGPIPIEDGVRYAHTD